MQPNLFTSSPSVQSSRILYTPSPFARSSLLHLQEVGSLTAIKPHTSKREKLQSYLCFMVEDGEGELVYEGKKYELISGDVVFIDCRKAYSHSTGSNPNAELWSLRWCHFYGPSMPAIYAKLLTLQKSYTKGLLTLLTHRETSEAPAYEYSVRIMQLFRTFSAGHPEIRCSDSGCQCSPL